MALEITGEKLCKIYIKVMQFQILNFYLGAWEKLLYEVFISYIFLSGETLKPFIPSPLLLKKFKAPDDPSGAFFISFWCLAPIKCN